MSIYEYIIGELKSYKHYLALYEITKNEVPGLQASVITCLPAVHSNNSTTEQNAMCNRDLEYLKKKIRTVDIWLELLDDKEKFAIINLIIHRRTYNTVAEMYYKENGIIYTQRFWRYTRINGINRIVDLYGKFSANFPQS